MISGALKSEEWEMADGKKGKRDYILVQNVEKFIFPKKEESPSIYDEELPFVDTSE